MGYAIFARNRTLGHLLQSKVILIIASNLYGSCVAEKSVLGVSLYKDGSLRSRPVSDVTLDILRNVDVLLCMNGVTKSYENTYPP